MGFAVVSRNLFMWTNLSQPGVLMVIHSVVQDGIEMWMDNVVSITNVCDSKEKTIQYTKKLVRFTKLLSVFWLNTMNFFKQKHRGLTLFLVGAFLGKSARLLQWLVFFRQTTDLIAYVPLFTDFTLAHMYSSVLGLRWIHWSRVRVLALARNFFEQFFSALCDSFNFFRHCATFFWNFFVAKGSPFQVFWYFAANWSFKKPKGSPFLVFWHYETVSKISFFVFFRKFFQKNELLYWTISSAFCAIT